MDRRGFLGLLAALPIVKAIVPKPEPEVTKEMIEKVLNHPLSDPIWNTIACSGVIEPMDCIIVNGSGSYR